MVSIVKYLKLLCLPKHRRIYVVLRGKFKGEWLVKVDEKDSTQTFFSLPDMYIRKITAKDFAEGITNKVIEPVDVLPESIYNVCLAEYNHKATNVDAHNTFNRRQQHVAQDPLDCK